jgi:L-asparaginase
MKKILLMATGGTIACKPTKDGLVPALKGGAMVEMIPELRGMCKIDQIELMNKDSSDIQPSDWSLMAEAIGRNWDKYDGFVITHGTDTMAHSAAALSFMLQNADKPVVLTGSQLPIEHPDTDAKANIVNAFKAAVTGRGGVYLLFKDSVIKGDSARKIHTDDFDAFCTVNAPPAAKISDGELGWNEKNTAPAEIGFKLLSGIEPRVMLLKILPGADAKVIDFAISDGYRGIVIEGFGAGNIPLGDNSLLPAVKRAIKGGITVVIATQCLRGGVHPERYPNGLLAVRAGALSAGRLTAENAAVKLMWALGNSRSLSEAKALFGR